MPALGDELIDLLPSEPLWTAFPGQRQHPLKGNVSPGVGRLCPDSQGGRIESSTQPAWEERGWDLQQTFLSGLTHVADGRSLTRRREAWGLGRILSHVQVKDLGQVTFLSRTQKIQQF